MTDQPTPTRNVSSSSSPSLHEEQFAKAQKAIADLFREKNGPDNYDGAFEITGLIGAVVEIVSIAGRLRSIVIRSGDGGASYDRAKLIDLLKDLGVYANISMLCAADKNWLGK